jgi:hypothetical protein
MMMGLARRRRERLKSRRRGYDGTQSACADTLAGGPLRAERSRERD